MKNRVIDVKNLTKRYQKAETKAVDDISFYVEEGAFFSFLGPNGAGKTTTISILTTTLSKTSGEVFIAGYDLDRHEQQIRQNIGIIFQKPSIDENLTAEENVRLHVMLYGIDTFQPTYSLMPQSYKNKIMELSQILGIKKDIFNPIKTFSGGMKRKLEIIRSLMHNPKILFLDEPTTGLDPEARRNLWEYLQDVREKEKTTIFLPTHYLEEAESADYLCVINHGKLVSWGSPDKIKTDLVQQYLVMDANDPSKLKQELTNHKIQFQAITNKNQTKYNLTRGFKINPQDKTPQQIIHQIKTPLTTLRINTPSLEEAYLEIINNQNTKQ